MSLKNKSGYIRFLSKDFAQCDQSYDARIGDLVFLGNNDLPGYVISMTETLINVALLFDLSQEHLCVGDKCRLSDHGLSITVSENLVDFKAIDVLGYGLVGNKKGKKLTEGENYTAQGYAVNILDRKAINRPLYTGKKVIDALLPIGKGQRQLIIGDGRLNVKQLSLDIIQRQTQEPNTIVLYVCIGKTDTYVRQILNFTEKFNNVLIVHSSVDILGAQVIAPQIGCAIAEYYRDIGKDVVIFYDDLSKHASYYRQINLLLKENPGREAYPSGIFSLHANLLERAGQFSYKNTLSSITALPIVDTYGPEMIGYVSTNIISITDGQCYISQSQYNENYLPPIDLNISVSRIGSSAQAKMMSSLAGDTKIRLSFLREMSEFAASAAKVDKKLIKEFNIAKKLLLQQPWKNISSAEETIVMLYALKEKLFLNQPLDRIQDILVKLIASLERDLRTQYLALPTESQMPKDIAEHIRKFFYHLES